MKLLTIIAKTLLGALFAGLGYITSYRYLSQVAVFGIPYLLPTLIAFVLGVFSVLLLPFLAFEISMWFKNVVGAIIMENLAEFWEVQRGRFRDRGKGSRGVSRQNGGDHESEEVSGGLILDTSAVIDGRILDVAQAGFLLDAVIVPRFVLNELQDIADSKDNLRRKRGRRGLTVLEGLRKLKGESFVVWEGEVEGKDVDRQLIALAKKQGGTLLTVDFNLNKAARVSGVEVLNVNKLANALKVALIPGETIKVSLVQKGKEDGQGVGYLEDGTMIVVEDGEDRIGEKIEVEVTRALQTEAGRMIFARPLEDASCRK